jgi:hypothetical protein
VTPSEDGGIIREAVVSASTFGPNFHQQFGVHLMEELKTEWQGHV